MPNALALTNTAQQLQLNYIAPSRGMGVSKKVTLDKDQKYTICYSFKNKMGISANNFVILELIKDGSIMYTRKLQATEATTFDYTAPATGEYTWRMRSSSIGTTTTQPITYSLDNLSIFYSYPYTVENCDNLADGYRFGYQGSEKDNEIYGDGNAYTTHFRALDVRLGRWFSPDPRFDESPWYSPYCVNGNSPIIKVDPLGDKEYASSDEFAKANKGKTWDKDRGKGDWLKSDREGNTDIWSNANKFNLQQKNGYKEYNSIEQRAAFYGWYQVQEDNRGGETKWAGAAYIVAKQMTLMDVFYKSGDLSLMYGDKTAKDLNGFANAGNKAIFDDVFGSLRDNWNGGGKKGADAKKWDASTLQREQFVIVQPIYKAWTTYNPQLSNLLQNFASGRGLSMFMQMPSDLKFKGSIMNPQDRYNHGMNVVVPFAERMKKLTRELLR